MHEEESKQLQSGVQAEEVEDVEDDLDSDPNWRKVREDSGFCRFS